MGIVKPVVESHDETEKTIEKNVSLRDQVNAALDDLDESTKKVRILVDKLNIENHVIIVEKDRPERKRFKWF